MSYKFDLVQNDTRPEVYLSLTDEGSGTPVDLSSPGTVIRLYLKKVGAKTVKEVLVLAKLAGRVTRTNEETGKQTITTAAPYNVPGFGGRCTVQWTSTSLDTPGRFIGELEVTFADGTKLTWYPVLSFNIRAENG